MPTPEQKKQNKQIVKLKKTLAPLAVSVASYEDAFAAIPGYTKPTKHLESYETLDAKIVGLKAQIASATALLAVYGAGVASTPAYEALGKDLAAVEGDLARSKELGAANCAVFNALPGYQKVAFDKAKMAALNHGATKPELEALLTEDAQDQWKFHFKQAQFSIQPSAADSFAAGTLSKHGKDKPWVWEKTCPVCESTIGWEDAYASVQNPSIPVEGTSLKKCGASYLCHVVCVPKGAMKTYTHANVGKAG